MRLYLLKHTHFPAHAFARPYFLLFQDPSEPNSDCSLSRSGPSSPTAINSAPEEESAPADTNEDNVSS